MLDKKMDSDLMEKSVLGSLPERQKDLFTLLSARDYGDYKPKINKNADRLLKSKNPEKQYNLISDWSRKWKGMISKPGCTRFLSTGYASLENPGGFTIYMFSPFRRLQQTK
jgi:hypothetical protein